ncbi:unnamed protein product, partial [Effrenium voratum]
PKPHPDCHLLFTLLAWSAGWRNALLPALTDMPKDAAPAEQDDDDDEKIQENSGVDANWTVEERQQVYARLHESGTPLGLPDVAFEAPAMVQDAYDACIQKSPGIQMMMDAILQAAKRMAWIWRVLAFMSMCVCVCVLFVVSHSIANTAGAWTLTTGSASSRFPC